MRNGGGIGIGAALGVAYGALFGDLAMALATGTALGALLEVTTHKAGARKKQALEVSTERVASADPVQTGMRGNTRTHFAFSDSRLAENESGIAMATIEAQNTLEAQQTPIERIDVSRPHRFKDDTWRPWFARLRQEAPVHYLADSENGAFWSVSSHDLIKAVDTNHQVFSSAAGGVAIVDPVGQGELSKVVSFITLDEPVHTQQRKSASPVVAPANLSELEHLIKRHAADILDNSPVGETFNWVDTVSVELTARMLATLFDFPYERRRDLIRWSDLTTAVPKVTGENNNMDERRAALMDCAMTFHRMWLERAAQPPKFDFVSMLAHGEATKHHINDPMLMLGNIILLIVGGNDTTRNSISGGVVALNQFPDEYRKLRENPSLIPNMVSEMIRWQTPVIHMRRTALEDIELGGKTIRKGDKVVMWYLSGNRDETVFPDADRLIIDRSNARNHLAFGFGVHRCMGNRLAEMQLRVLWEEIMARFHTVEVVGEVERLSNNFIRGIANIPVRLRPA